MHSAGPPPTPPVPPTPPAPPTAPVPPVPPMPPAAPLPAWPPAPMLLPSAPPAPPTPPSPAGSGPAELSSMHATSISDVHAVKTIRSRFKLFIPTLSYRSPKKVMRPSLIPVDLTSQQRRHTTLCVPFCAPRFTCVTALDSKCPRARGCTHDYPCEVKFRAEGANCFPRRLGLLSIRLCRIRRQGDIRL